MPLSGFVIVTRRFIALSLLLLLVSGCTSIASHSPQQLVGTTQTGKASYYAMKYQFRTTASGETFNQWAATAAHRHFPLGTKVRVTNLNNQQSTVVKINDRGPYINGVIIDLSRSAFDDIGDLDAGIIPVSIQVID